MTNHQWSLAIAARRVEAGLPGDRLPAPRRRPARLRYQVTGIPEPKAQPRRRSRSRSDVRLDGDGGRREYSGGQDMDHRGNVVACPPCCKKGACYPTDSYTIRDRPDKRVHNAKACRAEFGRKRDIETSNAMEERHRQWTEDRMKSVRSVAQGSDWRLLAMWCGLDCGPTEVITINPPAWRRTVIDTSELDRKYEAGTVLGPSSASAIAGVLGCHRKRIDTLVDSIVIHIREILTHQNAG